MKFVDEVKIYVKAGDGGNGCVSWRREKFIPRGGPAGGDGGNGGSVILEACDDVHSLLDFRYQPKIIAKRGEDGRSKNQYGKAGEDDVTKVPVGTQVFELETDECIADLTEDKQQAIICKGGSGGFGNTRFATSTRQAPDFAKPGLPGDEKNVRLSLKLLADVGLLGFPNAGKSTLLSRISAAKPKIADYPFTTLTPQLGVAGLAEGKSFVVADVPGLIENASKGAGLGFRFLKHLERVRVLCHLIEPQFTNDKEELIKRYETIRNELNNFNPQLSQLTEVVCITKIETIDEQQQKAVDSLRRYLNEKNAALLEISSVSGKNIDALKFELWERILEAKQKT